MLGRYLLAALADGVAAADEDIARRSISKIDWVLRGRALRRLNQLLIDAQLETGVIHYDESAARRHVLRVAALMEMGEQTDYRDREAVSELYADKTAVTPPRFPMATSAAGAIVFALTTTIAAATVVVVTEPVPGALPSRPTPPPPAGAFAVGGSPGHEEALEQTFASELPKITSHQIAQREPASLAHHPGVAAAWRELVDAAPGIDVDDRSKEPEELKVRLQVLSDQLAAANLGYFAAVERSQRNDVVIGIYRIAKVTFVRADSDRVRVLDVVRLKATDPVKPVLGMKADGMDDPIVMLDQVTAHVANQYLPVLEGHAYNLADDSWGRTARGRNATMAATRAIRRELNTALGSDALSIDKATIRLRKLVLASVRHHEAQHGHEQDKQVSYPKELASLVGPIRDANGRQNMMALRARSELSAYTSQIASDMWMPQAALWNLARHAFQTNRRNSPESYAAVVVIEGLARQLEIAPLGARSALADGKLDRDRLAELVPLLASKTTFELRSAAARLWGELFDEPLVRLVDDVFGE